MPKKSKSRERSLLFSIVILIVFVGLILYDALSIQTYASTAASLGSNYYLIMLGILCFIGLLFVALAIRYLSIIYPDDYNVYHYALAGFSIELAAFVFLIYVNLRGYGSLPTALVFVAATFVATVLSWRTLSKIYLRN